MFKVVDVTFNQVLVPGPNALRKVRHTTVFPRRISLVFHPRCVQVACVARTCARRLREEGVATAV